jgi:hypothetical protein
MAILLAKLAGINKPLKARQGWQQMITEDKCKAGKDEAASEDTDDDEDDEAGPKMTVNSCAADARAKFKALPVEEQNVLKKRVAEEALAAPPSQEPIKMQK